jgi:hypothetical protein
MACGSFTFVILVLTILAALVRAERADVARALAAE